jgi:hypothetical protein
MTEKTEIQDHVKKDTTDENAGKRGFLRKVDIIPRILGYIWTQEYISIITEWDPPANH